MPIKAELPKRHRRAHLLALEPRMMFDAAAVAAFDTAATAAAEHHGEPATFLDAFHQDTAPHQALEPSQAEHAADAGPHDREAVTAPETATAPREIIFIDTSVADYRSLADSWASRGQVVLIDSRSDGIDQVRAALAGQSGIGAIHIVSHGSEGLLWLGTSRIDTAAIEGSLAASLGAIGRSLTSNGDILLYGCDFAEGTAGARAVESFARATGADVAASTDVTGASARGGDWTLERNAGSVEAMSLDGGAWDHTLAPNVPVPISVTADSLTVTNGAGTVVVTGTTGYGTDARSPDVGVNSVAVWANAAMFNGNSVDLRATVISLTAGDAVRFNRPGQGTNGDDPTFLLRDLTTGATPATIQIRWELVDHATGVALPANVRFTIADIDGIGGNPNSRETVTASTAGLAYYTRERVSDIAFTSSLNAITASGTQDENTTAGAPITPKSAATFDWTSVSAFTLTYTLTNNAQTTQAQFFHDGDADFVYTDPVYVSVPRLDLDGNDSTAPGNDARFTYTENGAGISVVDTDIVVTNPMDTNSIIGATVRLTNPQAGDQLVIGTLPAGITATGSTSGGVITVTLSGPGSETMYQDALRAISFRNTTDTPSTTQRVIDVSFSNDTLTSAIATTRIDVVAVNDTPAPVGTLPARTTTDAATVSYPTATAFNDPDGDTLTYSATGLPAGLTINSATGVISGTVNRSASQTGGGVYTVTVTARDPSNAATTQGFTITVTNPAPNAVDDTASTTKDTPVTVAVLTNDSDPDGDPLTVTSATALHGSVVRNADGTVTYTPNTGYTGTDTISYAISDGQGGTDTAQVAVDVVGPNTPPATVGSLPSQTSVDAATVSYPTAGGFSDPDGDTLTYSATGLPAGLTINATTGVISGTIDRSASQTGGGSYTVVVTARDPSMATATQSFALTVTNPAPTAVDDSATTAEDTPVIISVLANDSDPDGDPLSVTAATALNGSVVRDANGTITYTPNANFNGTDTISYTISDGQGGTSNAQVAVTITPANDAPSRVGTLPGRTTADAATVSYPTAGGFTDIDGDTLTYSATGLPAGLTIDATTGVISGTVDRSASQVGGGSYAVVVTARDPSNASTTQSFTIAVANPAPTAVNDSASTTEDTPVTITVLTNDSDPDGDPLTVTTASAPNGTVVRNADGTLTYTPNANYNGSDTISYTISDGQGGTSSATVAVTIAPANDAPGRVGTLPARSAADAATVSYPTAGGFSDPDGDTLTYSATGLPAGLTFDATTGVISGTIDRSASQVGGGSYAIVVTARDPSNTTTTQSFTLTVTNPAPSAANDSASTTEETPVTITVLANDTDPDGDPLTVTAASAPNGTVVRNADGTLTYTPNTNYTGTDTISYTISDGQGGTSSATVTVTIGGTDDAPVAVGTLPARNAADAASVSYPTAGGFSDPDGDALTYSATGLPAGLTINAATGVISGTIDRSASQIGGGSYAVVVTARDPSNGAATQNFTITVTNPAPTAVNDVASTSEETPVTITVLANDTDPDGDPLTVTAASAPNGTVVRNPDGTLTYTPNTNYTGTDTISYAISDGQGGTSNATVTVTIGGVNDAPVAVGTLPARTAADAAAVSYPTAAGFSDPDGDALTYSATGLPAGLTINATTGVISGTVDRSASQTGGGSYTVVVTARDPSNATATQSFTIAVTNPGPTAVNDSASTSEDTPVTITVLANDTDPDGDPLTVTAASALHGTVVRNADGTLTYTPDTNYGGPDTISYTISDGQGGTSSATVAITVGGVNDAPTPVGTLPAQTASDAATVSYPTAGAFSDPDGDTLSYSATGLPAGLTINATTGVISGTVDRSASQAGGGSYTVVVTARDPSNATATQSFTLTVTNPGPAAVNDSASTHPGQAVTVAVLANDTDPDGDPLTVTGATTAQGTAIVNANNTITFTPAAGFTGTATIAYTISDGNGGTSSATLTVGVANAAPTSTPLATQTASDGQPVSFPVGSSFSDPDGDPLSFSATGLPAGLSIDPATGTISGTLGRSASQPGGGVYDIVVTADDGFGGRASATLRLTVANVAPAANGDTATTSEDTAVTIAPLGNDTDIDGDPLTIVSASAANGSVTVNAGGTVTYTPNTNFSGTDTISYTISDGEGGQSSATITVTVSGAPDAPVAQPIPATTGADGRTVSLDVSGFFSDPDSETLTYTATGLPPGLSIDPATGLVTGTITANASAAGPYRVTIVATDPTGRTASSSFDWAIANPPPVAANDTATVAEEGRVVIPVLANDSDPDGDPLTVLSATADHGTVTINPDGTLRYLPNADFNGQDVIVYTISDANGARATASVLVTVVGENDPPVAVNDTFTVTEDTPATIVVLANDRDIDRDPLTVTAATATNGTVTINPDGSLTYTPAADFAGNDVIRYTISDGRGGTATASVAVTVTPVNDAPTPAPDTATIAEDGTTVIDVLGNDRDADRDVLTVTAATAANGTVTINANGTLNYTPAPNFNGTDTIRYTVSDGNGGTTDATVAVAVTPVNDGPRAGAAPTAQTASDGAPTSIDTAPFFVDPDGDPLAYSATGLPAGLAIDPATGRISGTIDPAASTVSGGIYPIVVTVRDPAGATTTAGFTLTVVNPAPVAANDVTRTAEDTAIRIAPLANDRDPDGDPLAITAATAGNGTVTINPDGTIAYTPNGNFNGADTIRYTVSDGQGGTATAVITVTVSPVNDAPIVPVPGEPVAAIGGVPVTIDATRGVTDPDGDVIRIVDVRVPVGTVSVSPDGVITFVPPLSFAGTATLTYTVDDGNGGRTVGTIIVRVADGRGADIEQLLRIGRPTFFDPTPRLATVLTADGLVRNPLSLLASVDAIRPLRSTTIGEHPVTDAVNAIRTLNGTSIDPDQPITREVARLERLADRRDAGDRLFDQRWSDFLVKGLTGFSAAADQNACVMVESVVRGGAIYLEVRDIATDGRAEIRSVDVRMAGGGAAPDWIRVDPRGLAIIERAANMDELHLIVRVTRADGRTTSTPMLLQGATGEVELDRQNYRPRAAPLDATLQTPSAAADADAARLSSTFE